MRTRCKTKLLPIILLVLLFSWEAPADDGYELWMKYRKINNEHLLKQYREAIACIIVPGESETLRIIRSELKRSLDVMLGVDMRYRAAATGENALVIGTPARSDIVQHLQHEGKLQTLGVEGYLITSVTKGKNKFTVIAANRDIGLLYGAFHFLRTLQTRQSLDHLNIVSTPRIGYRLLDHWDNLDGSIERGYAGKSLWKWDELPKKIDKRYHDYARANASIGINGAVLNNVNANPVILKTEYLRKVSALANVFRPYGIRVFLSVNFSSPISGRFEQEGNRKGGIGNLPTADPQAPNVRLWWKNKVKEIYALIPDFGGFVVKANSEGMPGPQDYGRTHAEGANMLAEALEPFHGVVMWRAFVYNAGVDVDRVKRAALEFLPLDGLFRPNVFVQAKNGPLDFQPREPVQPLFGSMTKTPMMLELQITQEYLGHSTHLVYLAPMWKEYFQFDLFAKAPGSTLAAIVDGSLRNAHMTGIAGVANTGDDRNWCGHLFAQANWFAFGRLAWDHSISAQQLADEWVRMSLSNDSGTVSTVSSIMMGSREACVNYMTPLGLHHIMEVDVHYGPGPQNDRGREDWTSVYYHRADSIGLGFDRSSAGSNAVGQYLPPLRSAFDNLETCPEKYLLWFHHVNWDHRMSSGRTLWEELCVRYTAGTDYVREMYNKWLSLEGAVDPQVFSSVKEKLKKQLVDAAAWRDTCLVYFQKFSKQTIPGRH
ncbi:MAG: alpha-glucuronidase family glycosyl hydrolase [Ignavibacteriales bacterium]|nr:alpha-glucuronidase family glycosyl hydrolase [Ignavibacteriales bacterium]